MVLFYVCMPQTDQNKTSCAKENKASNAKYPNIEMLNF